MVPAKRAIARGAVEYPLTSSMKDVIVSNQADTTSRQAAAASVGPPAGPDAKSRRSLKPLLALKDYLFRHPGMLAAMLVAIVLSAGAMLTVPVAMRSMIDHGFSGDKSGNIDRYFAFLLGIGVVLALASSARFYCVNWLGERVVADIRRDVFKHLSSLSPAFFEQTQSGELMSRLTADTTQIKSAAGSAISQALRNLMMLTGAFSMMIVTSPKLSVLVMVAIPVIVLPLMAYGRAVRDLSRSAQDTLAEASAYAAENLGAIRTMQAFTYEAHVLGRFTQAVDRSFAAALARMRARSGLSALVIFLAFASVVGVLWYGATDVVAGRMTGGHLGQFVIYALFAAGAVAELSEVWGEVQQAAGAAERLMELLNVTPDIQSPANPVPLPLVAASGPRMGRLEFRNVSFSYAGRGDAKALHDISLVVEPGETVAIVGPSGAGKSTLFNLALRFYDPQSGQVLVDGIAAPKADLTALRRRFAVVPQDIALFAETIGENIRYGAIDAAEADVERAAKAAQAHQFITELPEGYATKIGERGLTLSGGQRQRIAIARAILRNAPILLLDEATSALDGENEHLVQQALEPLMTGRTTLVIAHRLSTVQQADRIVVLDKGRIVEQGTHAALVAGSGLYRRLSELQFRGLPGAEPAVERLQRKA
jgi:ATP-binding cassette, subfamily B, bacterial